MSSRRKRKSPKSETDHHQHKNNPPRCQVSDVGAVDLMRQILLEQARIKATGTLKGEPVKADVPDPFATNPTLRQIMETFLAKETELDHSKDAGRKYTGVTESSTQSVRQQDQIFVRLARPQRHCPQGAERDDIALLKEALIAWERTRAFTKPLPNHKNVARGRGTREAEIDPLSNESLLRVMPEFLAAQKQGKVTIAETLAPNGTHDAPATRTLKLMMASFLEKSVVYHMPFPGLHIEGVPDEDDQEKPLQIRRVRNEIRGFGRVIYPDAKES